MVSTALIWDPAFMAYRFNPDHPFNPRRLALAISLMEEMGLLRDTAILPPRPASDEELLAVHTPEYVAAVKRLSEPGAPRRDATRWGLGTDDNPIFEGMHDATALVVGGTLRAAELVMSGEATRALNIAGGLHHAHAAQASGFCVYSDLAVAIQWMRQAHGARVMYIDYDAHHGDGVQGIFYHDADVLTVSLHESGRFLFPGTGFTDELGEGPGYGFSLNVPLEPFTEDDSWIAIQRELLPEVAEAFRPDVIVLQNGCDGHVRDPLTHLRATTRLYEDTPLLVREIADRFCEGRLVATGGGGYDIWNVVPRAWTLVWAALSQQEAPDQIPLAWVERWRAEAPAPLPTRLRDEEDAFTPVLRRAEIESVNRRMLQELRQQAFPLLQTARR
jgi:acetoin utilization protein AcuC